MTIAGGKVGGAITANRLPNLPPPNPLVDHLPPNGRRHHRQGAAGGAQHPASQPVRHQAHCLSAVGSLVTVSRLTPFLFLQMLCGGDGYHRSLPFVLKQKYDLPLEVALHLAQRYGDRAFDVMELIPSGEAPK